jgi:hypothetical protein
LREQLKGTDTDAIKSAEEKLGEAMQSAAGEAYKATTEEEQNSEGSKESSEEKKDDGPVVDAEVVEEEK